MKLMKDMKALWNELCQIDFMACMTFMVRF